MLIGRIEGIPSPFRTRREPVRGALDESSMIHTVLKGDGIPPLLRYRETEQRVLSGGSKREGEALSWGGY